MLPFSSFIRAHHTKTWDMPIYFARSRLIGHSTTHLILNEANVVYIEIPPSMIVTELYMILELESYLIIGIGIKGCFGGIGIGIRNDTGIEIKPFGKHLSQNHLLL